MDFSPMRLCRVQLLRSAGLGPAVSVSAYIAPTSFLDDANFVGIDIMLKRVFGIVFYLVLYLVLTSAYYIGLLIWFINNVYNIFFKIFSHKGKNR
jgi:hypothetical protein